MVRLHYPKGHAYWQKNEFKVEVNGVFIDVHKFYKKPSEFFPLPGYEITIEHDGIYVQYCACGSGYGKKPISDKFLLVKCSRKDVKYVGKPLVISKELQNDINQYGY